MIHEYALPTAYPSASADSSATPQVSQPHLPLRETNNRALPSPVAVAAGRVSSRQLDKIMTRLSDRDRAVLSSVERYKFLTTRHIEALHFTGHASKTSAARTARRVLERLRHDRILATLERRIGGIRAGSEGLVYFVDAVGDRILRASSDDQLRRRAYEPSARFLNHTLAIADLAVALVTAARASHREMATLAPEPYSWRRYIAISGSPQILKPDLYVELADRPDSDEVEAFFIEVDLGQESLPTVVGKCHQYELYRQTGLEQQEFGSFPQVVWAMDAPRPAAASQRREALGRAIEGDQTLTAALFQILPLGDAATRLLAAVPG